jgi:NodT family efflux transporter outer membrane factor (OMF) lipoprotein
VRLAAAILGLAAALTLAGCATPGDPKPMPELPSAAEVGLADAATTPDAPSDWWRVFGDPRLDELVQRAVAGQPNLQVAQSRWLRAQAYAASVDGANGPQLGLRADANWQRYSEHSFYPPPIAGAVLNNGDLTLAGSVTLDFFGRHAAALRAALGSQRAAAADVDAARTLIAASVARQYFGLARLQGYRAIAQRVVALREANLALTRERCDAGLDPQSELHAAESALAEAKQQAEALAEQAALARHALAVFCGLAPQSLDELAPGLPAPQTARLPDRLGADLLGRRADVLAARWRVEASLAQVDEARAAFYPDINLVAFAGFSAIGVDRLLAAPNRQYGVGPALSLPIFDGDRLRAQQADREAERDAAVAAYRGVVLDAAREALDALASLQSLARQSASQAVAVDAAERGLGLMRQRRRGGLATELQLLAAEAPLLVQRRNAIDLQARAAESQVALLRALGGGWQPGDEVQPLPPLRPVAAAPTKEEP